MSRENESFVVHLKENVIRHIYRGPDDEIPSAVYDTIEILYKSSPMKPFIFKRTLRSPKQSPKTTLQLPKKLNPQEIIYWLTVRPKKKQTWNLVIHLPAGCDYSEFKSREKYFATAVGGSCLISKNGEAIYMTISNIALSEKYTYDFDPLPYLSNMAIPIFLGKSANGIIVEDFTKIVSLFVAGLRDTGKTVTFHQAIYTCLKIDKLMGGNYIQVVAIDPKLKELQYFEEYGVTWTHEEEDTLQLLWLIQEANIRRKNIIGTKANNILEYNSVSKNPLPYIMLFIDEVDMVGSNSWCAKMLTEAVQKYRSQGIYVVSSTQRPDADSFGKGNSFSKFKSQFETRLCYRMADETNSRIVIGSGSAANLPILPGRAIYKYGTEVEIQTPYFPSRIRDHKAFDLLMDQLPKVALPYYDIQGEVHDYEPESNYPRPRTQTRSASSSASRSLQALISGTNTFA